MTFPSPMKIRHSYTFTYSHFVCNIMLHSHTTFANFRFSDHIWIRCGSMDCSKSVTRRRTWNCPRVCRAPFGQESRSALHQHISSCQLTMVIFSWKLALLSLAFLALYSVLFRIAVLQNRLFSRRIMEQSADFDAQIVESLEMASTLRRFDRQWVAEMKTEGLKLFCSHGLSDRTCEQPFVYHCICIGGAGCSGPLI